MNASVISSNKQRGVYSEIINPDNSALYEGNTIARADESLFINTQKRQKIPRANALKSKGDISQMARHKEKRNTMEKLERIAVKVGQEDEFDLRVEPKVM